MPALALRLSFRFDQTLQSICEIGIAKDLAGFWCPAIRQIDFGAGWVFANLLGGCGGSRERIAGGKSVPGQVDGFFQNFAETHRAPTIEEDVPGIDTTRHRSRQE